MDNYVEIAVSDGTQMPAFVARPKKPGRYPGLLVFQEAFGVNAYIRSVAERFSKEGFTAVAPELFHRAATHFEGNYADFESVRPMIAALTPQGLEADLQAAYAWLRSDSQVHADKIASVGFCMGGRASFLMNALAPIQAAISFYGSGIAQGLLDRTASLYAPILFFWGARDKNILPDHIRQVTESLRQNQKTYVNVEFSDAGHGFFCDVRSSYDAPASAQAWPLCLAFLKSYLS